MITPQEKAKELVDKYYTKMNPNAPDCNISFNQAKQCALIAVDEIIKTDMLIDEDVYVESPSYLQYWQQVKTEIEKL